MTRLCHVAEYRKRLHRTGARIIKADMSISSGPHAVSLADLGWSAFFADQVGEGEAGLLPARIATVHRSRIGAETALGQMRLILLSPMKTTDFAVGDWVLLGVGDATVVRRLDRRTLLLRRTEGAFALRAGSPREEQLPDRARARCARHMPCPLDVGRVG
jgi:hypothetical protein